MGSWIAEPADELVVEAEKMDADDDDDDDDDESVHSAGNNWRKTKDDRD